MLKDLMNVSKNHNLTSREQLLSLGGGLLMLRKGITRPGVIGAVSLVLGAAAIYRGAKAYRAHKNAQRFNEPPVLTNRATPQTIGGDTRENSAILSEPRAAKDYVE
ncbi:MAG: hypothetical protein KBT85_06535 [Pseudomonas sp.]|jgi:uncharacterized membrane protein|uniref:hypothetical protein n=1 Tax=Halopseudomonas TaxID=2901189 RepID=UPI001B400306|nr:hypothetical protein [Pseudomonas sp.]MBQ0777197.1 hypothetical protein [Pseudomonas sp.]WOD10531.1 hypothetical protein RPW65_15985 [Pseudomonas sp. NyZ704]